MTNGINDERFTNKIIKELSMLKNTNEVTSAILLECYWVVESD